MSATSWPQCRIQVQDVFGPQVSDCYDNFDFTLLFEESILYLFPLFAAVSAALLRLWQLRSEINLLKRTGPLGALKPLFWGVFIILELIHLVLTVVLKSSTTRLSNAAVALGFAVSPIFAWLSRWEHARSPRPSTALNVYLLGTIPLDTARARTLFHMPGNSTVASVFTAIIVCKFFLFVLEATEKQNLLKDSDLAPEQTAGILNRSFLWWFNPLLLAGYKQSLVIGNLLEVDENINLDRSRDDLRCRWAQAAKQDTGSLWKVLLAVYKTTLGAGLLPRLCLTGVTYAQPFLVSRVTSFLGEEDTATTKGVASGLIAACAIVYTGIGILTAMFHHRSYRAVTMVRGGLILLIYDHTLRLNASSPTKTDSYTLITADIERIVSGLRSIHETWASMLEIVLSVWLLETKIAVSAVAPAAVVIVCLLASGAFSVLLGPYQTLWLEAMQARLTATLSMIGSMKVIKATGSAKVLYTAIDKLRTTEIKRSLKFRAVLVAMVTLSYVSTTMAPTFAFVTYSILAKLRETTPLLAASTFSSLTIITLLGQAVAGFVDAIVGLWQALASLERIRQYLAVDEIGRSSYQGSKLNPSDALPTLSTILTGPSMEMLSMGSSQEKHSGPGDMEGQLIVLKDHSAGWEESSKPAISGINVAIPRGSFVMLIGPVGSGKSTLLQSLLGEVTYTTGTVTVQEIDVGFCAQTPWLTNTSVRDNILGAIPLDLGRYNTVVKACALDHDFTQLPLQDLSIIGSNGVLLSGGQKSRLALARALYADKRLLILDDVFAGLDAKTEHTVFDSLFGPAGLLRQRKTTTILAASSTSNIASADYIMILGQEGTMVKQGTPAKLLGSGTSLLSDKVLGARKAKAGLHPAGESPTSDLTPNTGLLGGGNAVADPRRSGDLAIYKLYISTTGWWSWFIFLVLSCGYVATLSLTRIWLKFWTEANSEKAHDQLGYYASLYAVLSTLAITSLVLACLQLMLSIVPRAAKIFHDSLLKTVMRAPLVFFSRTDSGEISNHFSQDLELIDMELPRALIGTVIALILCITEIAVVVYSSNYFAIAVPALLGLLYLVQMFYLRTSQRLRVLELEARAPLLSHFMETIQGLVSVRAFGWTTHYTSRLYTHLKTAQQSTYLLYCAQVWLTLMLDMIVALLAIILVSIAMKFNTSSAASIGLALVNVIALGANLKGLVYNWTALENAMGAIMRVRSFTVNTPCEIHEHESDSPPPGWPQHGLIQIKNVTAGYDFDSTPILHRVTLTAQPGEKIAICGRTGCGKSSLVNALLRLLEVHSGTISIDGVDISTIFREDVRRNINTVPQEPFFYHGTIRQNLDTTGLSSDEEILEALATIGIKDTILKKGGLDMPMNEQFLSHGQQQLLCFSRAVLRKSKVLILDEATSSVDQETESLMLEVLHSRFQVCTVISIAHRLQTIMHYDKVVVLDQGRIVEEGNPRVLAEEQSSIFANLLQSTRGHDGL